MNRIVLLLVSAAVLLFFLRGNNSLQLFNCSTVKTDSVNVSVEIAKVLNEIDLAPQAYLAALAGLNQLKNNRIVKNDSLLSIIDYSQPSDKERFFVFDVKHNRLIEKSLVAHGCNSGGYIADSFSNGMQTHKSSLGFFVTAESYNGRNGYSLKLIGLEKGLNDNALERAIVIHGANYVSHDYIEKNGRIGRSFGCPALPVDIAPTIIDLIKNGSCLYIYHTQLAEAKPADWQIALK